MQTPGSRRDAARADLAAAPRGRKGRQSGVADVNGRVARLLLDLADEAAGERITRRLTHHTIAQMIGSSRETVSRTMRELVDKGLIEVSRRDIVIRDRSALEAAAGRS
jgi:CRP-like cAMP-binding protein